MNAQMTRLQSDAIAAPVPADTIPRDAELDACAWRIVRLHLESRRIVLLLSLPYGFAFDAEAIEGIADVRRAALPTTDLLAVPAART
jgi:hypothetical protein